MTISGPVIDIDNLFDLKGQLIFLLLKLFFKFIFSPKILVNTKLQKISNIAKFLLLICLKLFKDYFTINVFFLKKFIMKIIC